MDPIVMHDRAVVFQGNARDTGQVLPENSVDAIVTDPPAAIGFMGKAWDGDKGGFAGWVTWLAGIMEEAMCVLKPGGYGLVWALPRTSHWTACALELAGFEIRDIVLHLFGTGFPKSMSISKAIDTKLGIDRPVVGDNPNHRAVSGVQYEGVYAGGNTGAPVITGSGSPEAAQWEGWGTALKPACEHWILVRKPLDGTVAENVLKYGVGGINIDACRIGGNVDEMRGRSGVAAQGNMIYGAGIRNPTDEVWEPNNAGRWPAHIVLSHGPDCEDGACEPECPVKLLDEQSGKGKNGGASRFFYVAKSPRKEKDAGLDHLPIKTGGEATDREDGSAGLKNPRAGAGRTGGAHNYHPTVKSIGLMRWLVRLVTPPGGLVLDPFAGSGSTGVAALAEGMRFVGIELGGDSGEYLPILEGRIRHALGIPVSGEPL